MKAAIGLALAGAMLCAAVVWSTALVQTTDTPYPMIRADKFVLGSLNRMPDRPIWRFWL